MMQRPTAIYVLGFLHILVGGLGVLWNGAGTISLLAQKSLAAEYFTPKEQTEMAALEQGLANVPFLVPYQIVAQQLVPWLLTLTLLIAGVGLLQARPWARSLSIGYAVASILHKLAIMVFTLAYLLPVYKTPIRVLGLDKMELPAAAETVANLPAIGVPLALMLYPILVLVVMYRHAVIVALTPVPPARPSPATAT